jgi:hypothetical protein
MTELEQFLNKAARAYYAGQPIITDDQFDRLADSCGYSAVGARSSGPTERHLYQMYYKSIMRMRASGPWKVFKICA